jgi:hypothetical protein
MIKNTIERIHDLINSFNHTIAQVLLVPLLFIPLAVVFIYASAEGQKIAQYRIERQTDLMLRVTLQEYRQLLDDSELVMRGWSEYVSANLSTPCGSPFLVLVEETDRYLNYGVLDAEGNLICSGLDYAEPVNAADRLYFKKVMETKGFSVGEYQVGRVTNKPAVNFGYPVLDGEGNVVQVLYLAFNLDWLGNWVDSLELSADTELIISDYKGTILSRHPLGSDGVPYGISVGFPTYFSIILAQRQGAAVFETEDGVERVYSYGPLATSSNGDPVSFVIVGVSREGVTEMTDNLISTVFILFWLALLLDALFYYLLLRKTGRIKSIQN